MAAALLLLAICLASPHATLPRRVYDWFIVLDITQSMNVRDYTDEHNSGRNISRLELAKQAIRQSLRNLPCGSQVALGLFTERETLNIVRPLEVCTHFSALDQTVSRMDWRMAWAADSFIAHGIYSAIEQAPKLGKHMHIAFITDGNQAPPVNEKYMPAFVGKPGNVQGTIFGAGKTELSPIPKLDEHDNITGYWDQEEVMQFGTFGMAEVLSVLAMEGHQASRNEGHSPGAALLENAHLSGVDESNLQRLSKTTGLEYSKLDSSHQLAQQLTASRMATWRTADTDLRPWLAVPALILLIAFFIPAWVFKSIQGYLIGLPLHLTRKKAS
ncbi:hypothetical protein ZMTM_07730 [Methyloradius palustris]|uniref:MxaL protein n=1 Tax=Methyloradius palustris TaxID=2778876 RepID=A0A8D5FYJ8_9PROT|nr:hypothetical protein ZMTM_07730 [Methyloradius palustris]